MSALWEKFRPAELAVLAATTALVAVLSLLASFRGAFRAECLLIMVVLTVSMTRRYLKFREQEKPLRKWGVVAVHLAAILLTGLAPFTL